MQVSEVHEHVNHAIIGGQASIEMGISTSAEFFNILSSTLYRDQMLAMVREVMCNAWDAHIENGIRDTPITVTVTPEHFIVTDYGRAIHQDDMGPIYGVYGNSTKKNDGNQTGGFGLGCKSPFAYTDHFEVTSCHEGIKTIYRISKAAVQNGGKPAIIPIASFPTRETGLSVKIDVKSAEDKYRILGLVQRIAFNGEMLVTLNGTVQERLGFNDKLSSYHVYRQKALLDEQKDICIRYGNVIYPMEECSELNALTSEISTFLDTISGLADKYDAARRFRLLFQAPAHSLSVTPSRESLSMQEHTIKTLKDLFEGFLKEVKTTFEAECKAYAIRAVDNAVAKKDYKSLLNAFALPAGPQSVKDLKALPTFKLMAEHYLSSTYPKEAAFRKADWIYRIKSMIAHNLIDRGLGQTWLREAATTTPLEDNYYRSSGDAAAPWLSRRILAPVLSKLSLAPEMDPGRLYIVDSHDARARRAEKKSGTHILAKRAHPFHLYHCAPYLRKLVVLARSRTFIEDRCSDHDVFKTLGPVNGLLLYHVGLKMVDAVAARAFWAKSGMQVVDMIDRQDWEVAPARPSRSSGPKQAEAKIARAKGLATVSSIFVASSNSSGHFELNRAMSPDADRLEAPEYAIRIHPTKQSNTAITISFLDSDASRIFARLYGNRGVVCSRERQYQSYITEKGALSARAFLNKEVFAYFQTNLTRIKAYWSTRYDLVKRATGSDLAKQELFDNICKVPELVASLKLNRVCKVDQTMLDHIKLYSQLTPDDSDLIALRDELHQVTLDKSYQELIDKICHRSLLGLIDRHRIHLTYLQAKNHKDPKELERFLQVFTTILEN